MQRFEGRSKVMAFVGTLPLLTLMEEKREKHEILIA